MKQLFTAISGSIYNPEFYRSILARPLGYSWKYYSAFAVLIAVVVTIASSVPLVLIANKAVREFPQKFFAYYPDGFEVTITNGVLSTNAPEPYMLPIPEHLRPVAKQDGISTLVVFDTKTPFARELFEVYRTLVLVGSDYFAYRDADGGVHIERFGPKSNLTINEGVLRKIESYISPYYRLAGPMIVLGIFVGLLIALGINFLYMLFGALLVMLLTRAMGLRLTYGKAYQVGLHALTLSVLLNVLFSMTPIAPIAVPFLSSVIMLGVVYANFRTVSPSVVPQVEIVKEKVDTPS